MTSAISRRKFIAISAAASGAGLACISPTHGASAHLVEWTGLSLGSIANIRLHHDDRRTGEELLRRVVAEARRLEAIFSLYRTDSALSELNQRSVLVAPPAELVDLLVLCDNYWNLTGGVFDPTVQPLWQCYATHFASTANEEGPSTQDLERTLQRVGWQKVQFDRDRVGFETRDMALTLNGVAQGYITDRVVDLLRNAGLHNCIVDMGEIRTLGTHPNGRPWQVAVRGPTGGTLPLAAIDTVNKAVATSGADGFQFDKDGRCNHLFNPATGLCAKPSRSLTVVSDTAAAADALSTALSLMDEEKIRSVLARSANTKVYATMIEGTREITANA